MIEFNCPHCMNYLEVDERFAGHDGWCRVCKNPIHIPKSSMATEQDTLQKSPERLVNMLRYAAQKMDAYKEQLRDAHAENQKLEEKLKTMQEIVDRIAGFEQRLSDMESMLSQASKLHEHVTPALEDTQTMIEDLVLKTDLLAMTLEQRAALSPSEPEVDTAARDTSNHLAAEAFSESIESLKTGLNELRETLAGEQGARQDLERVFRDIQTRLASEEQNKLQVPAPNADAKEVQSVSRDGNGHDSAALPPGVPARTARGEAEAIQLAQGEVVPGSDNPDEQAMLNILLDFMGSGSR